MIVATSFYPGDACLWFRQMEWIEQLSQRPGGSLRNTAAVLVANGVRQSTVLKAKKLLNSIFGVADVVIMDGRTNAWPQAQNLCFRSALKAINGKDDMLWMESDVVCLKESWMSDLLSEWNQKLWFHHFMGKLMETVHCNHISGVAVYGRNWKRVAPDLEKPSDLAWDVACARFILPHAKFSHKIQQVFSAVTPPGLRDLDPRAVLYHQDKSGHLIDLLREKLPALPKPKKSAKEILRWESLR